MRAVLLLYIINFRVKVTSGLVKKALILTAGGPAQLCRLRGV